MIQFNTYEELFNYIIDGHFLECSFKNKQFHISTFSEAVIFYGDNELYNQLKEDINTIFKITNSFAFSFTLPSFNGVEFTKHPDNSVEANLGLYNNSFPNYLLSNLPNIDIVSIYYKDRNELLKLVNLPITLKYIYIKVDDMNILSTEELNKFKNIKLPFGADIQFKLFDA